nr:MAG TPA: hypothetical protein [Caudoviricetes sp.]
MGGICLVDFVTYFLSPSNDSLRTVFLFLV